MQQMPMSLVLCLAALLSLTACQSSSFDDFLSQAQAEGVTYNMESEVGRLVARYQQASQRVQAYTEEAEAMEAREAALEQRLRGARQKLAAAQAEAKKLDQQQAQAAKTKSAQEAKLKAALQQEGELKEKLAKAAKELADLTKQGKELQENMVAARKNVGDGKLEWQTLAKEDRRLKGELASLQDRVNKLKKALPEAEVRIAALEEELKKLQEP